MLRKSVNVNWLVAAFVNYICLCGNGFQHAQNKLGVHYWGCREVEEVLIFEVIRMLSLQNSAPVSVHAAGVSVQTLRDNAIRQHFFSSKKEKKGK